MSESFAERWRRKELDCGVVKSTVKMWACGEDMLPDNAGPFNAFEEAARLLPIYEVYGDPDWSEAECERLAGYRVIGFDGAGNPICIEQGTGAVVLVDHEDWFRPHQFINSSVRQLAECLLAYMGEKDATRFRAAVQGIDAAAMAEESFWWYEGNMLEDMPNWPPVYWSASVYEPSGEQVGEIARRSYGTFFFCSPFAKGKAFDLDGIQGKPRELVARMRAEGFEVRLHGDVPEDDRE
jgi:hypothetical protein